MRPLQDIFEVTYGNKFDANKAAFQADGVNFVSRSSKNLGIIGKVEAVDDAETFEAGLITVTLGGTYLLSAFVQPEPFYTAQNIKVLRPREVMSLSEKIYYCECIRANRFKYSTHGREANRSLDQILLPSPGDVPNWVKAIKPRKFALRNDHKLIHARDQSAHAESAFVRLDALFEVRTGVLVGAKHRSEQRLSDDYLPYMRPSKSQITSFVEYVDSSTVEFEICLSSTHAIRLDQRSGQPHLFLRIHRAFRAQYGCKPLNSKARDVSSGKALLCRVSNGPSSIVLIWAEAEE